MLPRHRPAAVTSGAAPPNATHAELPKPQICPLTAQGSSRLETRCSRAGSASRSYRGGSLLAISGVWWLQPSFGIGAGDERRDRTEPVPETCPLPEEAVPHGVG